MGKYLTVLVFILILLIFDSVATYSQSWTNPVNVSSAGSNDNPSLAISTDGTLHCVWSHAKGAYLSTLFYSKSTDNGTTWSEPLDITANYNKWLGSANIVCDSFNNLYVSYDYDLFNYTQTKVFYKKFNGFSWGDSIRLSGALNGVWNNRLTIDQNNKVYCFWYGGISSGISYICIENGIAGNIINPYSTQGKQIRLSKATCDNSNNVHCIGTVYNPSNPSDFPQSIYFNSVNGDWSDIQLLTSVRTTLDNDLSLNKAGIPDFVFAVITDPFNDGHCAINTSTLSTGLPTIPEFVGDSSSIPAIITDINGDTHIVATEDVQSGFNLVHFFYKDGQWKKEVIDTNSQRYYQNHLYRDGKKIYWIYKKLYNVNSNTYSNVVIRRLDVVQGLTEKQPDNFSRVYPNPFCDKIEIELLKNSQNEITVDLFDPTGNLLCTKRFHSIPNEKARFTLSLQEGNCRILIPGLYFLFVSDGGLINRFKVIKTD